jgi:hypothetical protein
LNTGHPTTSLRLHGFLPEELQLLRQAVIAFQREPAHIARLTEFGDSILPSDLLVTLTYSVKRGARQRKGQFRSGPAEIYHVKAAAGIDLVERLEQGEKSSSPRPLRSLMAGIARSDSEFRDKTLASKRAGVLKELSHQYRSQISKVGGI